MKYTCAFLLLAGLLSAGWQPKRPLTGSGDIAIPLCGPAVPTAFTTDGAGKFAPLFPGSGTHTYTVSTRSDSAQLYFSQGLRFYYSYHYTEAVASFKEAARFDSTLAMAYWGEALALGPNINVVPYRMPMRVLAVVDKMNRFAAHATPREQALMQTLSVRYEADTTQARRIQLNTRYADALRDVARQYPEDADIQALFIDAVMNCHPWDLWNTDGTPKPWTPEVLSLCTEILKKHPEHPAALHYHIHLTEASHHPEASIPSAETLRNTVPGIAHMVHMASHTYARTGQFSKGVAVNDIADHDFAVYDALAPQLTIRQLYQRPMMHYYHVQTHCAMNLGAAKLTATLADRCRKSVSPEFFKGPQTLSLVAQYVYATPELALVRLGKWEEILRQPAPDPALPYAYFLHQWATGMALVRTGDTAGASRLLAWMETARQNPGLAVRYYNAPAESCLIAQKILEGELAAAQGANAKAVLALQEAVQTEDALIYREPMDWPLPARHYLGALLVKQKQWKKAEEVYRKDLVHNPNNGWSETGLSASLLAQHKTAEARVYARKSKAAFTRADIRITASAL